MMDILVIVPDLSLGRALCAGVREAGHESTLVTREAKGLVEVRRHGYDAIVLDCSTSLDFLRTLRQEGIGEPVIAVSTEGSVESRVAGLKAGADDYMVKPVAVPELLARLETISRRSRRLHPTLLKGGDITLDLSGRRARRDKKDLALTPSEFTVLELLLRQAGQVVSREELSERLWPEPWAGAAKVLEVHVNRLRSKLDDARSICQIKAVRGKGYLLLAPAVET